jgi:hypothetical protein
MDLPLFALADFLQGWVRDNAGVFSHIGTGSSSECMGAVFYTILLDFTVTLCPAIDLSLISSIYPFGPRSAWEEIS